MEDRPYFQTEEKAQEAPYWQARQERDDAPYWQAREPAPDRPYWEPTPEKVEIITPAAWPAVTAPPPAPEPAGALRTISYFMFQDESGVKHLSNVPVDPRYREFTVTVRLGRGLAGTRSGQLRFTHENLRPIILRAAGTYNLDPALIAAVIKSESAFDAHAVSWAGAQGLMQLMPTTARDMDCADPFDPAQNIMAGSRYLRLMLDTFGGDLTLAVASYNCGPEKVRRLWRVPDIPETKNYVLIVSRNYERYKGQF
jgi:soluble lytic murein transglycosylase